MKPTCRRRTFLQGAGAGLTPRASRAVAKGTRAIKLSVWPDSVPFVLDGTFGPGDAAGVGIHRWLFT